MQHDDYGRRSASNERLLAVIGVALKHWIKRSLVIYPAHTKEQSFIVLDESQFLAKLNILQAHTTQYFFGQCTLVVSFK